jgi:ribonuclease E
MAEEASKELESDTILNRKAEEAKPRQEAAVKGVRPSQPAPTSVPRAERKATGDKESSGGLLGFIKKLFGSKEEVKPTEKRQAGQREGRNGDRNRNRNNRNRNRNKNEAGRDSANGEEKSETKEARQPNQRNGRNQQRQNKPEANQEAKAEQAKDLLTHAEVPPTAEAGEGEERRRGRNRRGRNRGRDRAERGENNAEANTEAVASTESSVAVATSAATANTPVETHVATPVVEATPVAFAPEVSATPVVAAATPAPVVEASSAEPTAPVAPAPLPKVEFKPLQTSELTSVIESAGMVWVNTDHQKLEEVRAQIAAEPAIVYPPREPKPPVEISTGPMVLVETGGKEQTIQK